nr:6K2 [Rose yellow mosaic virus]
GAISEQIDEQILLKKKFVLGKVIVPCLLGLIAMCGIYAYYRLRKHYEVVE